MDEALVKFAVLCVADRAWKIASEGEASAAVCLAIEDLSDDPAKLVEIIKEVREWDRARASS